ncbi:TlpA disulfide reductase family protein [Thermoflexibacter ruber]|uniref:Thiol-disulfide isomerase or thioredoxin n=1 Tax=Thermoflexibacter ruber TaxID=1003 RepID=A0A1I2EDG1_9BACT|nr:TlpA disulfide reductase family protein [Thermoflexibacter ruber]SFE90508.1 Thiol-disulfide isomerase or thioredoxin [Thermoflexibacter ruber]
MKKNIFLALTAYIPFLLFGHIKNLAGWEVSFVFYSICYFFLGLAFHKVATRPIIYHSIIISSLLGYAIFLYTEMSSLYFPAITPATFFTGGLSYLLGYYYRRNSIGKHIVLIVLFLVLELFYTNYFVRNYIYNLSINTLEKEYLLGMTINVPALKSIEGRLISEEYFANKVLVLDFWYTKCGNCMPKLKELDKIYEHFANNPDVLVASIVDGKLSSMEETKELLKTWQFKHPIYYDSMGIFINRYQIGKNGYPVELRIGKDGRIKQSYEGLGNPKISNYVINSITDIEQLLND